MQSYYAYVKCPGTQQMRCPVNAYPHNWTVLELLRWTGAYFRSHAVESPRTAAEVLLAHSLGWERIDLYVRYDQPLTTDERERFKALIRRRLRGEPIGYITGRREFWSLLLTVGPSVLIPRPETERLVEAALVLLPDAADTPPRLVIDLGTGSGAVVLALASERPRHRFFACDRFLAALDLAHRNACDLGLAERVHFFAADWLAPIGAGAGGFDLIVSNPPYIPSDRIDDLQPEIRHFEPRSALDGGPQGTEVLAHLVAAAPPCLRPGGWLLLEIGHDQRTAVQDLAAADGRYAAVDCWQDYAGLDRVMRLKVK